MKYFSCPNCGSELIVGVDRKCFHCGEVLKDEGDKLDQDIDEQKEEK